MSTKPDPDPGFLAFQDALAGRYSLEHELGRGGMGIVYLARDLHLERLVAIKLLPPVHAARPALRERFVREARTAAKLSHPNIVPIHAVDEVDGFVFFVMAFVEGETLGRRVRERGPLAPRDAARILREVSWALAYAHAQGVVHRDVKPDNVLIEAGTGRALVTDFGIAQAGGDASITSVGELLGTPEYMSPEQASGEAVDGRSDLYAVGVMGHYALSGTLPHQGASTRATLAKQITQVAPALASVAPELPLPLCEAMDRCLAKDPAERFQGGEELAEVLGGVLDARPEVPTAIRVFMERNRESTSTIVGVVMMALMMVTTTWILTSIGELEAGVGSFFAIFTAVWLAIPFGMLGISARTLLKAGHRHDELVRALTSDVDERRRELASQVDPKRNVVDVLAPAAAIGGLGLLVVSVLAILFPFAPETLIESTFGISYILAVGGGIVTAVRHELRKAVPGSRWLSFWKSPVGRGLFGLAGIGAGRDHAASGGAYGPTEIAIGMAAERLFEELPKDVRRSLSELPAVVDALERHAERTRARMHDLDRLLAGVDDPGAAGTASAGPASDRSPGMAAARDSVADEVRAARDAAEARLRDAVAALERVRLELLRLHAGSGTVEGMTADLSAARALSEDMERLLEGRKDVGRLLVELVTPATPTTPLTPTSSTPLSA